MKKLRHSKSRWTQMMGMASSFALLALSVNANAGAYTETLSLCDLGIMNPDRNGASGVDLVAYTQYGHSFFLQASPTWNSALARAQAGNGSYDRWDQRNGFNDIDFQLQSDYYGTQYYLEYCYTWDHSPLVLDKIQYRANLHADLPVAIPNTDMTINTYCVTKSNKGEITNYPFPYTSDAQVLLTTDIVSMRCTVRLTFNENAANVLRPHNTVLGAVDPHVSVKVDP